ncbi:hypothetical protein GGR55DRAFT_273114 [Xylaria sp. FL0064]|nr:hypothetical protein GGR55DRAFT_273114 [Xylaria sp. FL0064]
MSERCCNSPGVLSVILWFYFIFIFSTFSRPVCWALFGIHLCILFRGISAGFIVLHRHDFAAIIHWYSNAQIWSLILRARDYNLCITAVKPLIGIMRLGIPVTLHGAIKRILSFSIGRFSFDNKIDRAKTRPRHLHRPLHHRKKR